jgi:hypothetical protein
MKPVSREEISAIFDGELTPDRAKEVRHAIVENEQLRRIHDQMAETDIALSSFATACQFEPHVSLPNTSPVLGLHFFAVALSLLIIRIVAKALPFGLSISLQTLAITILAGWLFHRFLPTLRTDVWQAAHELGGRSALPP